MGRTRGEIGHEHEGGVHVGGAGNGDDLALVMGAEFGRVNAVEKPLRARVFAHVDEVAHGVGGCNGCRSSKGPEIGVVSIGGVGIAAADFVPADWLKV
jgi:hypothetical protein